MQYRRTYIPGTTYFFTVNLADRSKTFLVDYINVLRDTIRIVKQRHPFQIDAIVILPEHLHTLWTLPPNDSDYAMRWMLIKASFSRQIPGGELRNRSRVIRSERGIWQRRYWEHWIRDEHDFIKHVDYIHYNPIKHGYVSKVVEWPFSSIHRYIRSGNLLENWEVVADSNFQEEFGERGE